MIAASAFLVLLRLKEGRSAFRFKGEPIALAWLPGSIGFCGFGSFVFLGQQLAGRDGALTASIMMATQPMMGLIVNSIVRKILPPLYSFLFILMSFAGVALVVTKGDIAALLSEPQHYSANALIVVGALCWVIYTFSASTFKTWSALKYTTMTTLLGLTTIIGLNVLLFALHVVRVPTTAMLIAIVPHLLYMGPFAGFNPHLFRNMGEQIPDKAPGPPQPPALPPSCRGGRRVAAFAPGRRPPPPPPGGGGGAGPLTHPPSLSLSPPL